MATTPSLKVVKQFSYRGVSRKFSNRYHFNGGVPADTAHWTTFSDAVVTAEKAIFSAASGVSIVATYGYAAGSDVPVFSKTYSQAGTGAFAGEFFPPGDVAGLIRYATTARTAKNHPVYLFNYYHGIAMSSSGGDAVNTANKTAMTTYGGLWVTPGFSDGTTPKLRAGPNGATATGVIVATYLTHRDLPRA